MKKLKPMRYISRIDSGYTHCYYVRVGYDIEPKVHKTFTDSVCGGKRNALKLAKKWRDQQLKKLLPTMYAAYGYDVNDQRHWGKGVNESWDRKGEYEYLSIVATYWDNNKYKQLHKSFAVGKHGYDKAWALATQWRKLKITGEL